MSAPVACEGAPRDLGRDQGRACGERLRARFASLALAHRLRLRLGAGAADALHRELARHFPRQAETLTGIAAAARVPLAFLEAALDAERGGEVALALEGPPALVLRPLGGEWILRRSRPEGGFRSVEVTRPWLAHALVGVNEEGLAAAVAVPDGARAAGLPSAPLVTDCLQRFGALEPALEWCLGRPARREAVIVLADAGGEVAAVEIAPEGRRVLRAADGWLAAGGSPAARGDLAKRLRERAPVERTLARVDPAARAIEIAGERFPA